MDQTSALRDCLLGLDARLARRQLRHQGSQRLWWIVPDPNGGLRLRQPSDGPDGLRPHWWDHRPVRDLWRWATATQRVLRLGDIPTRWGADVVGLAWSAETLTAGPDGMPTGVERRTVTGALGGDHVCLIEHVHGGAPRVLLEGHLPLDTEAETARSKQTIRDTVTADDDLAAVVSLLLLAEFLPQPASGKVHTAPAGGA